VTCGTHDQTIKNVDDYQKWTRTKIAYPREFELEYLHAAISEEVGELNGKRAKAIRKQSVPDREAIALELGDILWDVSRLADAYGYKVSELLYMNFDKLEGRAERGTIVGSGDYR
jgi:NTP pyrophosphatase (non-canonical NTP hydrolase)